LKVSAHVKIAMQYFEILGGGQMPPRGCAPVARYNELVNFDKLLMTVVV